jgi:hypothetical protein
MEPSIKGFAMLPAARRVSELRGARRIDDVAWGRLEDADRELVDKLPSLTIWYPIACQGRLLRLVRDAHGGTDQSLLDFAHQTAGEVMRAPALRVLLRGASLLQSRLGPTLVRMAGFGFSFGTWRFEGDDLTDFQVIAQGVAAMPDEVRINIQGFIDHVASQLAEQRVRCRSTRPEAERIVFEARVVAGATR